MIAVHSQFSRKSRNKCLTKVWCAHSFQMHEPEFSEGVSLDNSVISCALHMRSRFDNLWSCALFYFSLADWDVHRRRTIITSSWQSILVKAMAGGGRQLIIIAGKDRTERSGNRFLLTCETGCICGCCCDMLRIIAWVLPLWCDCVSVQGAVWFREGKVWEY